MTDNIPPISDEHHTRLVPWRAALSVGVGILSSVMITTSAWAAPNVAGSLPNIQSTAVSPQYTWWVDAPIEYGTNGQIGGSSSAPNQTGPSNSVTTSQQVFAGNVPTYTSYQQPYQGVTGYSTSYTWGITGHTTKQVKTGSTPIYGPGYTTQSQQAYTYYVNVQTWGITGSHPVMTTTSYPKRVWVRTSYVKPVWVRTTCARTGFPNPYDMHLGITACVLWNGYWTHPHWNGYWKTITVTTRTVVNQNTYGYITTQQPRTGYRTVSTYHPGSIIGYAPVYSTQQVPVYGNIPVQIPIYGTLYRTIQVQTGTVPTYRTVYTTTTTTTDYTNIRISNVQLVGVQPTLTNTSTGQSVTGQFCSTPSTPIVPASSSTFPDYSSTPWVYSTWFSSHNICNVNTSSSSISGTYTQWAANGQAAKLVITPTWKATLSYDQVTYVNGVQTSSTPMTQTVQEPGNPYATQPTPVKYVAGVA